MYQELNDNRLVNLARAREIARESALHAFAQADIYRDIEDSALCRTVALSARESRKACLDKAFAYLDAVNDCTYALNAM
jgi:hypothetical protein